MCRWRRPAALLAGAVRRRTAGDLAGEESLLRQCVKRSESVGRRQSSGDAEVARLARFYLALQGCQTNRFEEADELLAQLGLSARLADEIWAQSCSQPKPAEFFADVLDNGLSAGLLERAREALKPESSYWEDHRYHDENLAFYSHAHLMGQEEHIIDEVIEALRPMLAEVAPHIASSVTTAEWWVHQRGRDQWHGHPLHFDTNEQLLRDSRGSCVQHPAVSTVVYLCDDSPRFGPTLVTDQRLGDSTGKGHATLVEPRLGRALFFDGGYLHGAMPGKPWLASPLSPERRLNLMVGWWTSDISTQAPADPPRPLMRTDPAARWVKDFACQSRAGGTTTSREEGTAAAAAQSVEVRTTSPTWVDKSCAASRTSANDAALLFGRFFLSHLGQIDEDIFN